MTRRRLMLTLGAVLLVGGLGLLSAAPLAAEDEPTPDKAPDQETILKLIAPRPGEVIADVGCGKGTWTFPLAVEVGDTGRVIAVDINEKKTRYVRKLVAERGLKNIEVIQSVPDNPMLAKDSLDAVFVNNVIDHVHRSALAGFLTGLRSALKPSGRLIIQDPNGGPGRVIAECYRHGFTLIEARVPLDSIPRPGFTGGWYALKLQRADLMPPALLPRRGKPSRGLTRYHLAEELFRMGLLTRAELRTTWDRIDDATDGFDPAVDERLDMIRAAEAIGAIPKAQAETLRARVRKP